VIVSSTLIGRAMRKPIPALLASAVAAATLTVCVAPGAQAAATAKPIGHSVVVHDDPPPGFTYEGTFYWDDSCEEAGKGGIPRAWASYVCIGDWYNPFGSYDLYVLYKS
jgi:hypothetical protein